MKKLIILVDMDDVLEDLVGCWISELNQRYGLHVRYEDITDWKIGTFFPSISKDELYAPLHDPAMWKKLQPMQNAQEVVKRLIQDGHTVRVVTASHYATVHPKMERFLELYPYLSWKDVIVASDKSRVMGDVLIDDGPHNLLVCTGIRLLFDRPHNQKFPAEKHGMQRIKTWDEVYDTITELAKE